MASMRLFVAINLPREVQKALTEVQQTLKLKTPEMPIKWVDSENLHLTLEFLGEIEENRITVLKESLKQAVDSFSPISVFLEGIGAFPNLRNPRIVWVGLGGAVAQVKALQARIHQVLSEEGFVLDNKLFNPHLTLGRVKQPGYRSRPVEDNQLNKHFEQLAGLLKVLKLKPVQFKVKQVELMQSILTKEGPIYSVLERMVFSAKISG
jgi:2'-5' RNA ligase